MNVKTVDKGLEIEVLKAVRFPFVVHFRAVLTNHV